MNKSRRKTKFLVLLTMFCSIQVVLMLTPLGYIPIGPVRATTMHIPVILAGILLGVKGGAITGLVFGISSVITNTIMPTITSFVFTPFYSLGDYHGNLMSLVIAIGPRVLLGVLAAFIYKWFKNKELKVRLIGSGLTALVCTMIHSILVLGMIYLFFGPSYAQAKGVEASALFGLLLTIITTNSILEAVLATVIITPLTKVLEPITKKVI
ncbi:ECF transporter S component [Turicibacter sp. TJ11]|uniref:ECF transporter S component n=1 Tax=Turicibacter sp. TJ11 TaxID=2806443 RepID=UPI001F312A96|nr:ECF transporter S component [Turicibacter sp. TJ11]